MLYKQLTDLAPDYAAIAFDLKAPTFRHKACDYYKATRKGMPEELAEQLEPAKNIARLMGFHELSIEGYEADDILGTLSMLSGEDTHAYLMTGDRDSYQLITDTTSVLYVSTKETVIYGKEKVAELYGGLSPGGVLLVKNTCCPKTGASAPCRHAPGIGTSACQCRDAHPPARRAKPGHAPGIMSDICASFQVIVQCPLRYAVLRIYVAPPNVAVAHPAFGMSVIYIVHGLDPDGV